jgi:hypothetical protein
MPRRLLLLNGVLLVASAMLVGYIAWELTRAPEPTTARTRPPGATAGAPSPAPAPPLAPVGTYGAIASRNLFSPTRSEAPPSAVSAAASAPPMPKPNLYGVVLRDNAPIAYLEDPVTKRVAGYRIGDSVAGGTVQRISADRVVLARPDGQIDVQLHDPSRPRAQAPAAGAPGAAGAPVRPPVALPRQLPGVPPGAAPNIDPSTLPAGRRLPPSLLRRLAPQAGAPADAPSR